jgi:hypothetical protein
MSPLSSKAACRPKRRCCILSPGAKWIKKAIGKAIQEEAFKEILKLKGLGNGKLHYGDMDKVVKKYNEKGYQEVTRDNLNYRLKKLDAEEQKKEAAENMLKLALERSQMIGMGVPEAVVSEISDLSGSSKSGGRPKGSTKSAANAALQAVRTATSKCVELYLNEKSQCGSKKVPNGTLERIVSKVESEAGLEANTINRRTVRHRVLSGNVQGINTTQMSPVADIEPLMAEFCIRMARLGEPLSKTLVINLANDLIADTDYKERVKAFKARHKIADGNLGDRWYQGFMKRNDAILKRHKTKIKDVKRRTWVTEENFQAMYDNVYEAMVEAGVAEELPEPVQLQSGRPTKYNLIRPECVVFVDETGCNTNQKDDGHVGGELFVLPVDDDDIAPTGATTDIHFTVLAFTLATGHPIMCAVIFKSDRDVSEIPISWKLGIDITKPLVGDTTTDMIREILDDDNGPMSGGPKCRYNGKEIPCFLGASPKASITSELLMSMLKYMDELDLFERSTCTPFLLLDGHGSRMQLPFLKYINEPSHKWVCCIGVPYATHIWQVADASELNGLFKIELTRAKREYLWHRSSARFLPTDIIPLLNIAWPKSFGNQERAARAIEARGWNPLNYSLLDHPALKKVAAPIDLTQPMPNIKEGLAYHFMDKLIEEEKRNEGRVKKFKEAKESLKSKEAKAEKLATLTKVSSSVLAVNNHFVLDKGVLSIVERNEEEAFRKRKEVETRKAEVQKKADDKYFSALNKYGKKGALTKDEMKVLLTRHKTSADSPIKSKVSEIRVQFDARKHRLQPFLDAMDSTGESNEENEAPMIDALNSSSENNKENEHPDTA